jgi:hypothetical protein
MQKSTIVIAGIIILIGVGAYLLINQLSGTVTIDNKEQAPNEVDGTPATPSEVEEEGDEEEEVVDETETVLGESVEGRAITAYHYGEGDTELLFVGGIHGGYSWNTVLVAYELMDYLEENVDELPGDIKVTVIPVLNPDGLNRVVGSTDRFTPGDVPTTPLATVPGRFNANEVDLNRNFDCDWQSEGKWQNTTVSGGDNAFSEPESAAIKAYIEAREPKAVVVWYSAAGGVYASNCHTGILSETREIMNAYARASGYPADESFDFYAITGDMVNWLAKEKIPAISVLLTNHKDVEWNKNKAGIEALIKYYSE